MIMIKKIRNCFDKSPVNFGRQREIDITKGIAVIIMMFSHALEILGWFFEPEVAVQSVWYIADMVISGSAPVFVLCMGIGLSYTSKKSAKDIFRRALNIAGLAVLLEIARTAIPGFLEWLIFKDPECIEYVYLMFTVDILQFAALAMLVIALFKKLNLKPWTMVIISVVCSIAGQLLQGVSTGSNIGDIAAGFFWCTYDYSYFPLLNWLIFPVCGYAFGGLWLRLKDKDTFFSILTPVSAVVTVLYFISMFLVGELYYFSGGLYRGLGIIDAVFMLFVCFAMVGMAYYISKLRVRAVNWLESMGKRVTSIYFAHWTIYCFLYLVLVCVLEDYISPWTIFPTAVLVLIASDLSSRLYIKTKRNVKK